MAPQRSACDHRGAGICSDTTTEVSDVLERCDICGFLYDPDTATEVRQQIVAKAAEIAGSVAAEDSAVTRRPNPDTWSILEYGCHVRDVLLVQRERVLFALRVDEPHVVPLGATSASRPMATTSNIPATLLGR